MSLKENLYIRIWGESGRSFVLIRCARMGNNEKQQSRGLFFCEHGIVIDTCEELDHLGEQAMQYLKIALREKDTQVIPFVQTERIGCRWRRGKTKDMETEKVDGILSV